MNEGSEYLSEAQRSQQAKWPQPSRMRGSVEKHDRRSRRHPTKKNIRFFVQGFFNSLLGKGTALESEFSDTGFVELAEAHFDHLLILSDGGVV